MKTLEAQDRREDRGHGEVRPRRDQRLHRRAWLDHARSSSPSAHETRTIAPRRAPCVIACPRSAPRSPTNSASPATRATSPSASTPTDSPAKSSSAWPRKARPSPASWTASPPPSRSRSAARRAAQSPVREVRALPLRALRLDRQRTHRLRQVHHGLHLPLAAAALPLRPAAQPLRRTGGPAAAANPADVILSEASRGDAKSKDLHFRPDQHESTRGMGATPSPQGGILPELGAAQPIAAAEAPHGRPGHLPRLRRHEGHVRHGRRPQLPHLRSHHGPQRKLLPLHVLRQHQRLQLAKRRRVWQEEQQRRTRRHTITPPVHLGDATFSRLDRLSKREGHRERARLLFVPLETGCDRRIAFVVHRFRR